MKLDLAALPAESAGPCQGVLPVRPLRFILRYCVDADAGRDGAVVGGPFLAVLIVLLTTITAQAATVEMIRAAFIITNVTASSRSVFSAKRLNKNVYAT